MYRETLDLLAHELGEIYHWEEERPGVYYLSILPTIGEGREYYAVLEGAPSTQEARAIGRKLEGIPVLVYRLEAEDGTWMVVEYEILRSCVRTILGHTLCHSLYLGDIPSATARWITGYTG